MDKSTILLILLDVSLCFANERLILSGFWCLNKSDGEYGTLNASVPGGVFSDLFSNGIIEDPLFDENDQTYKWVGEADWIYFRNFTVSESLYRHDNINIVFEGLDTIASIHLNGIEIGNSTNMFLRYIFDIKNNVRLGNNLIEVKFSSPVKMAKELANAQNLIYPIPPQCPPSDYRGECHINHLRKMQASFSWDWGPALASMGIWKNVFLEGSNTASIRYVMADIEENIQENVWNVTVKTFFSKVTPEQIESSKIMYKIETDYQTELIFEEEVDKAIFDCDEPFIEYALRVPQNAVKRWWPNGYGEQALYRVNVTFASSRGNDTFSQTIGFRTVKLVQRELTGSNNESWGNTFYFEVNGIPIFAKGSNYIPLDILPEKGQNKTKIDLLLQSARDCHMNMLRVWGGGVYESDYFYQKADELGIMIWQDFMFACALYPTGKDFLSNVKEEVRHQVKRISSHPSIVIWAGNNENEAALTGNWYGSGGKMIYNKDYKKLYLDTVKVEFEKLSKSGIFASSSPSNGVKTERDGGISSNPYDQLYGDDHTYIYELDCFNPNIYPTPRFSSEYGFQSYPSYSSLKKSTNNVANLIMGSEFLKGRQHHPLGDFQMKLLIFYQLDLPPKNCSNYTKAFIYYSQVIQAVGIKTETEHYRKYRSILTSDGKGFTMGALYWQLNDVWIAPTWSGIDSEGNWKMLQYFTRDMFFPLITVAHSNPDGTLEITVVSDKTSLIDDVKLSIAVFRWTSFTPLIIVEKNITIEPLSSKLITTIQTDNYLQQLGCGSLSDAANNCFFTLNIFEEDTKIAPENYFIPGALKRLNLQKPEIQVTSVTTRSSNEKSSYKIELKTSEIALFVWLESGGINGKFSENGFHQITEVKTVYFETSENTTSKNLKESLQISNILHVN